MWSRLNWKIYKSLKILKISTKNNWSIYINIFSQKIKEIRELNTEIYRLKYKVQELEQLLESEPRHEFMSTPIQFDSIKEERDDVKVKPYVELK